MKLHCREADTWTDYGGAEALRRGDKNERGNEKRWKKIEI
jgi:hypothetical protein